MFEFVVNGCKEERENSKMKNSSEEIRNRNMLAHFSHEKGGRNSNHFCRSALFQKKNEYDLSECVWAHVRQVGMEIIVQRRENTIKISFDPVLMF
jgi:hypothetical protein